MAFPTTPQQTLTTKEIEDYIVNAYKSKVGVTTVPEKGIIRAMAGALAGIYVLLYRLGNWAFRQIFIQTADPEAVTARGEELGIFQGVGTVAVMRAQCSGVTASTIPAGTLYQINDNVYTTTDAATPVVGIATLTLQAPQAGEAFQLSPGDVLQIVRPSAGIPETATIVQVVTEGEDPESFEDYFNRVDARIKRPPQGGSAADYYLWATEVEGIVDCLVYNTQDFVLVLPIAEGEGDERFTTESQRTAVTASIESSDSTGYNDRRPVTHNVFVAQVLAEDYNVTINGFGSGRPQTLIDNIESEIQKYFDSRRPLLAGLGFTGNINFVNRNDLTTIVNTLTNAEGFSISSVNVTVNGSSVAVSRALPQSTIANLTEIIFNA